MSSTKEIVFPKTYCDREARQNSKYFFISYSHKDKELVYDVLNNLYEQNVNYWYDVELDPGDVWNKKVEKIINNAHCRGAVIFLSENSLISNACREEVKLMLSLANERDFRIIPIIIGHESAKELILNVANSNDDFYQNGMMLFRGFTIDGIWKKYEDSVDDISSIAEKENVKEGYNLNVRGSFLQELDYVSHDGNRIFHCGKYPFDEEGNVKEIEWNLISNDGELYYLVSKYCVDFVDVNNIEKIIEEINNSMNNQFYIEKLDLINEEFINDYSKVILDSIPTNFADRNRQQLLRLFWVKKNDGNVKGYVLYNSQNIKINENIKRDKINAGIRLVLVINNEKIGGK